MKNIYFYLLFFLIVIGCCDANKNTSTQTVLDNKNEEFKKLGFAYYVDSIGVFCDWKLVPYADPFTFETLLFGYSRDKNFVYYDYTNCKKVLGADPKTIQILDIATIKDGFKVYHQFNLGEIEPVENINVKFFRSYRDGYFIDSLYLYSIELDILLKLDTVDIDSYFPDSLLQE